MATPPLKLVPMAFHAARAHVFEHPPFVVTDVVEVDLCLLLERIQRRTEGMACGFQEVSPFGKCFRIARFSLLGHDLLLAGDCSFEMPVCVDRHHAAAIACKQGGGSGEVTTS